jgi:hypothetical protein
MTRRLMTKRELAESALVAQVNAASLWPIGAALAYGAPAALDENGRVLDPDNPEWDKPAELNIILLEPAEPIWSGGDGLDERRVDAFHAWLRARLGRPDHGLGNTTVKELTE